MNIYLYATHKYIIYKCYKIFIDILFTYLLLLFIYDFKIFTIGFGNLFFY